MKYKVKFNNNEIMVEENSTVLEAAIKLGLHPDAPCGGKGLCGKCMCKIFTEGKEKFVLACQYKVTSDLSAEFKEAGDEKLLNKGSVRNVKVKTAIDFSDKKNAYGVAFDIGTTSVVCYLLDLKEGYELANDSMLNPQTEYGGDVISRAEYAINNGPDILADDIRQALNRLIDSVCVKSGINKDNIYVATVVGNTCMHHLFLSINPKPLVIAPYEAVVCDEITVLASECDIDINPKGILQILPNIAGFVGADTVGVLLSAEFDKMDYLTLMIDIGTNGEIVIGNKNRYIASSTAAGPAFEGAKIECGMRGKDGAVDHIEISDDGRIICSVIGGGKATGICGSGLLDAVSVFLEIGIIDETGKIIKAEDITDKIGQQNKDRIIEDGNNRKIKLTDCVYISQKDVREVQLAKGAIAAGIEIMTDKLGYNICDIKKVLIAGAFGNYMNPNSACDIGMIPEILRDKIEMIGNAAGEGAKIATLNVDEFKRAESIAKKAEFLELASCDEFQDTFVDNLSF